MKTEMSYKIMCTHPQIQTHTFLFFILFCKLATQNLVTGFDGCLAASIKNAVILLQNICLFSCNYLTILSCQVVFNSCSSVRYYTYSVDFNENMTVNKLMLSHQLKMIRPSEYSTSPCLLICFTIFPQTHSKSSRESKDSRATRP